VSHFLSRLWPSFSATLAWKAGSVLIVAIAAIIISCAAGLQGRTIENTRREAGSLILTSHGIDHQVVSLRRPDQAQALRLEPIDFIAQADGIGSWAEFDRYLARQAQLRHILDSPQVWAATVPDDQNRVAGEELLMTSPLTISMFNHSFWVCLIVGLAAFLVGTCVWCLKPSEQVTRILAINGFAMLLAAVSSSASFAQPVALSASVIAVGVSVNHLATVIFGLTLVGLFLRFPNPLVSDRQYRWVMAIGVPVFLIDRFRLMPGPDGIILFCAAVVLGVLILVGVQYYASRRSASARAALLWLGLAVIASGGSWIAIVMTYMVQGRLQVMPESFVFVSFLILYAGVAIGVARFRLFEVSDWAFRIFFFTIAALLFIAMDAGLVYLLGLTWASSLTLALLAVAFGYLPLRDFLWRRFVHPKSLSESEILSHVLDMAFVADTATRQDRWQTFLQELFAPLSIRMAAPEGEALRIEEDGLHLYVPGMVDMPALRLSFPQGGRGLFPPRQVGLLAQIMRLSQRAAAGLSAYERGAAEQREKLAQDLHDTVSSKLVSGLSVADEAARPFIHSALDDIRDIASALNTESVPLDRVIADMRHEAVRRLDAAQIELEWPAWPDDAPFVQLTAVQKKALTASVRELITNIIKHAGAGRVSVELSATPVALRGRISDDGTGFPAQVMAGVWRGQGLKSVTERLSKVSGHVSLANPGTGAVIAFDLPFQAPSAGGLS